jgi:CheY-like chemotaxis protein
MVNFETVTILLVEDDPGHARLIEKNLRRAHITNELVVLDDGQKAVDYIDTAPNIGLLSAGHPSVSLLVLLDLNLPVLDGYQVLEYMRSNERFRCVPVIILTTSDDPQEIERCYTLGCSVCIVKPVDYTQFADAISKLGLFLPVINVPEMK